MTSDENLERTRSLTEAYVRDCCDILGIEASDPIIQSVVHRIKFTMTLLVKQKELELAQKELQKAALDAVFTPEEQARAKEAMTREKDIPIDVAYQAAERHPKP